MRRTVAVVLLPLLSLGVLAGCGGSSSKPGSATAAGLPTVNGAYGSKPTFTFPSKTPPSTLQSKVLRQGTGPVVNKGDLLVADYLGTIWGGKSFDNSYDRKAPSGFPIGVNKVVPGWDKTLVGVRTGSRVLMSLPPIDGYGSAGNSQAGIAGTDTLVFVVDIVAAYAPKTGADPKAVVQPASTPGITVSGALGGPPTIKVVKGTKAPTTPRAIVLAKGTGPAVIAGQVVLQYVAAGYDGANEGSSWTGDGAAAEPVAATGSSTPFDTLRGIPLGSRVLVELPAAQGRVAIAVVLDLIAEPKTAALTG